MVIKLYYFSLLIFQTNQLPYIYYNRGYAASLVMPNGDPRTDFSILPSHSPCFFFIFCYGFPVYEGLNGSAVVDSLFIVAPIVSGGFELDTYLFCYAVLCVLSSSTIISFRKRKSFTLLVFNTYCLLNVMSLL